MATINRLPHEGEAPMLKWAGLLVLSTALVGCASVQPLAGSALPKQSSGYVGGNFTLDDQKSNLATAFVLVNLETGAQQVLPFTARREVLAGHNETVLVELPKGTYRLTHWTVYKASWGPGSQEFRKALRKSRLTEAFRIDGGEVVFVGKFSAGSSWSGGMIGPTAMTSTTSGEWRALDVTEGEARRLLAASHPGFSAQKLVCMACEPEPPR
jgi:hypothetical protein